MRYWRANLLAIGGTVILASCSGTGPASAPSSARTGAPAPSAMLSRDRLPKGHPYVLHPERDASPGHIYSSSFGANTVTYYNKARDRIIRLPEASRGRLRIRRGWPSIRPAISTSQIATPRTFWFIRQGATSASLTLTDPNGFPDDIAFGSDGTAYVANLGRRWATPAAFRSTRRARRLPAPR